MTFSPFKEAIVESRKIDLNRKGARQSARRVNGYIRMQNAES